VDVYPAGGGGGATETGKTPTTNAGGVGGNGTNLVYWLLGLEYGDNGIFGGGGGGGTRNNNSGGNGGLGGGGKGGGSGVVVGSKALPNTGGGGGGGGQVLSGYVPQPGGGGGAGIVIIRYSLELVPFFVIGPTTLADIQTGSERFTNSNEVELVSTPVPADCNALQFTESGDVSSVDSEAWIGTNAIPERVNFTQPVGDTNVVLYVWFTNTTQSVTMRRSKGEIYYTEVAPIPSIRASLARNRLAGGAAVVTVADIDIGSQPGTANGIAMNLHARKVRTVDPAADLTPDEPHASLGAAGEYPVVYWMRNEAGNEAYSSVTCLVTVADVAATTNFWTGGGATKSWNNPDNWLAGVPFDGQHAAITGATAAATITASSAALASFTMRAGTLTFTNWTTRLEATEVALLAGSVTLPPAFTTSQMSNRVWIVCSNLTVSATATVQANERGYFRGQGVGIGAVTSGGSHGGRGSTDGTWAMRVKTYGSLTEPTLPGNGGKTTVVAPDLSTHGGGAIRIDASGEVAIHGQVTANSANAAITHHSGGAGGSILINCRTFAGSGTGLLSATGGSGNNRGGAGGGGRIAVVYDTAAQAGANPGVRFNVLPGPAGNWAYSAEPGTIYFSDTAFVSTNMTTQWLGGNIHIPGFTNWTANSLKIAGKVAFPWVTAIQVTNNMILTGTGALTIYAAPTNAASAFYGALLAVGGELALTNTAKLTLISHPTNGAIPVVTCDSLLVGPGTMIDADYKGYAPLTEGTYTGPGGGVSGTYSAGGAYGGHASPGLTSYAYITKPYGDVERPLHPGSAGGHLTVGGYGGGAIVLLVTNAATIHGTLSANGSTGGSHGGGGSGGTVLIECRTFLGSSSGLLRAQGGTTQNSGGSGSGGRIAVRYNAAEQAALPSPNPGVGFSASPGIGGVYVFLAERGTLYLPEADTLFLSSHMTAQWQDVDIHIPGGLTHWALPSLQLDGKFNIPGLVTMQVAGNLTIASGGRLSLYSHPSNAVSQEIGFRLDVGGAMTVNSGGGILLVSDTETGASPYIECGSFNLKTNTLIDADFRGFHQYRGAGRGTSRAGGGYGGAGSRGADVPANAGKPYARAHAAIYPGSGAGDYGNGGGRGGGLVRIGARGEMKINGIIRADGLSRIVTHAGGGSGGGILLTAGTFAGAGTLQANGGNSGNNGGPGGGGRICVWTPYLSPETMRWLVARAELPGTANVLNPATLYPNLKLFRAAGTGGTNPGEAGAGTVFFGHLAQGMLIILR
jgi:hypothetical protein